MKSSNFERILLIFLPFALAMLVFAEASSSSQAVKVPNLVVNPLEWVAKSSHQNKSSDHQHRIVGGQPAANGQFPYQVSLRINNQHFCGGSIISQNWILTAAHCLYGQSLNGMTVVAGTNTLNAGGVAYPPAQVIIHEQYNPQTTVNDIAVLKVQGAITLNSLVKTVAMTLLDPLPNAKLTLSGWGLTSYPGNIPNNLQHIQLTQLPLVTCAQQLQGSNPIGAGQVCTTSPVNQGACQGDSGGPLVNALGAQVGIVSWGIPCAKGLPDVFTSVAFYRAWVLLNTGIIL